MSKPEFIKLKKPSKKGAAPATTPGVGPACDAPVRARSQSSRPPSGGEVRHRPNAGRGGSNRTERNDEAGRIYKGNRDTAAKRARTRGEAPNKRVRMDRSDDDFKGENESNRAEKEEQGSDRSERAAGDKMAPRKQHARDSKPSGDAARHRDSDKPSSKKSAKRSEPKMEYVLDDATAEEKVLIRDGTISDRIDCLTLLCARNPSPDNYKQLLFFAENQRNDVIYHVLKNLRDLLKEGSVEESYIRSRIIKSYERGVKNPYIKNKVLDIVTVLTRAGIYAEDFLSIVVERLMEKGETLAIVENSIRSLFLKYEEIIMANIEDFYYKNDTFRVQYLILRFLSTVDFVVSTDVFDFYNQALTTLDSEYSEDHRALMLDLIINGLSKSVSSGSVIERVDLIRGYLSTPQVTISALKLLVKTRDQYVESFVLKSVRSLVLRRTKQECELLNIVSSMEGTGLVAKLVNNCFYYPAEYIISVIMVASEKGVDPSELYSLTILARHYHPAVRDVAVRMLRRERISLYDPYDSVVFEGATSRLY